MARKTKRVPFGENLASIRKTKGITQVELAKLAGVSQRVIAGYETVIKNPTPDIVIRLAKALKVSIDELMGFKSFSEKGYILKNKRLLKKLKALDNMPPSIQKRIIGLIDDLSGRNNK